MNAKPWDQRRVAITAGGPRPCNKHSSSQFYSLHRTNCEIQLFELIEMYQSGGYKRERIDESDGYGPPQKRVNIPGGGYGGGAPGGGRQAMPYSNYPSPPSKASARAPGHGEEKPNNILLFTVFNPKYPITVDVMHTICTANGAVVNRIVIFRKNGVQAMVEFDSIEAAESVKESLNGADIYSGCCTLKVDWGKPTRLNVVKNDQDSWDYTTANLGVKNDFVVMHQIFVDVS